MFPNKPTEMFASDVKIWQKFLKEFNQWIAQQKVDGFRTMTAKDSTRKIVETFGGSPNWARGKNKDLFFLSRRDLSKGGPTNIPVSEEIVKIVESLELPDLSMLDGEWMARRTIGEIPESLFFFDIMWKNDDWKGVLPFKTRHEMLMEILENKISGPVKIPETYNNNFRENFDLQKQISWTEGLVFKHLNSIIISDRKECVKNPLWIKIKWRSGDTGRDAVYGS